MSMASDAFLSQYAARMSRALFVLPPAGAQGLGGAARRVLAEQAAALFRGLAEPRSPSQTLLFRRQTLDGLAHLPDTAREPFEAAFVHFAQFAARFSALPEGEQANARANALRGGWSDWGCALPPEEASPFAGQAFRRLAQGVWGLLARGEAASRDDADLARREALTRWGARPDSESFDAPARCESIARRFGFHALFVMDGDELSPAQQRTLLDRLERTFDRACRSLGCDEPDLGMRGLLDFQLASPGWMSLAHPGDEALFTPRGGGGRDSRVGLVTLSANGLDREDLVAHEWTHALDWRVGRALDPGAPNYFSLRSRERQMELSPLAAAGLDRLFAAAGAQGDLAASRSAIARLEMERDSLAENLSIETLGPLLTPARRALNSALSDCAPLLAHFLAPSLTDPPRLLRERIFLALSGADSASSPPTALARAARQATEAARRAMGEEGLARLADALAHQTPILRRLAESGHVADGKLHVFWAADSSFARFAAEKAFSASTPAAAYWLDPKETLARAVGRPLSDSRARSGPQSDWGPDSQRLLREGLASFAAVVGVRLTEPPAQTSFDWPASVAPLAPARFSTTLGARRQAVPQQSRPTASPSRPSVRARLG
jgi:hypothetical protein